jgi:hypothetical protein
MVFDGPRPSERPRGTLRRQRHGVGGQDNDSDIVPVVGRVTRLVAPVLLPIIDELAELTPERIAGA